MDAGVNIGKTHTRTHIHTHIILGSDWLIDKLISVLLVANRDQANIVGDPTAAGADLLQGGMENTGQAVSYHDNRWKNDWSIISDWQVNVNKNILRI